MSKTVIINNISFEIPEVGEENYGEELTAYLVEIANVLNTTQGPLDVTTTDFTFVNNQATPANVTGLSFATSNVAQATITYVITRDNGTKITEAGEMYAFQGDSGWELSRGNAQSDSTLFDGDCGIEFSITSAGQVQYTSQDYSGQISGVITFKASTMEQD